MDIHGLYVPLVTPFAADGSVDLAALERLAGEVLDGGADGLVALGTTGEPATLDVAERHAVIDACARACRGAPLVVGAGSNDTRRSVEEMRELGLRNSEMGQQVSAALVSVPPVTRPTEDGVLAHFAELAAASPVPVLVYNIPYRTGLVLSERALRALAGVPGVVGVKQAVGCVDATTVALLADPPPGFAVLAGDDPYAAPLLALGGAGAILASAHLATDRFAAMVGAWRRGDAVAGRAAAAPLSGLSAALFAEPNPTVLKGVLHAAGRIPTPDVRLPLLPASPAAVAAALARVPS